MSVQLVGSTFKSIILVFCFDISCLCSWSDRPLNAGQKKTKIIKKVILVKGAVPGAKGSDLLLKLSIKRRASTNAA